MNMFWKKMHIGRSFSVISVDDSKICGGKFHRKGKMWKMVGFSEAEIDPENPAAAWKKVARTASLAEYRVITGKVDGGCFFRFVSAEMSSSAQRGAVEFELPRHMLKVPDECSSQFCVSGSVPDDPESVMVNVAAYPTASLDDLASVMRRAGVSADEFISPFLAVDDELASVILPEIDPDFAYVDDSWMPMPDEEVQQQNSDAWLERLKKHFLLPKKSSFDARNYLMVLLAADVLLRKHSEGSDALRVLPDQVRTVRFRGHLIVTGLLVAALAGLLVWRFMLTYGDDIAEYRRLTAETGKTRQKINELKNSIRRNNKDIKDMTRLVESRVGEAEAIAEFAVFSSTLPDNVLVSSIRWGEKDIDVVVLCEDSNMDFDRVFRPLRYWKVTQQGRQNPNQGVATITLKLTPYGEE